MKLFKKSEMIEKYYKKNKIIIKATFNIQDKYIIFEIIKNNLNINQEDCFYAFRDYFYCKGHERVMDSLYFQTFKRMLKYIYSLKNNPIYCKDKELKINTSE